ncbi:MAG: TonB-dependent receptor [Aquabacterium sp.]
MLGLSALACGGPALAESGSHDVDFNDANYPIVITPTRLKQSQADVPASITVITAETISRYGITSIPEALRLVPGMHVSNPVGNTYEINYHGTLRVTPRRLNVLIDGVSAYQPAVATTDWLMLPVAVEDIARIEVIRGPDSASYGPNSMLAVINILTKHPKDVESVLFSMTGDDNRMLMATTRASTTLGSTSMRLTADILHDDGYDGVGDDGSFAGWSLQRSPDLQSRDGTRLKRVTFRAEHELSDRSTLQLSIGSVQGWLQKSPSPLLDQGMVTISGNLTTLPGSAQPPDSQRNNQMFSLRWTKQASANHELQVEASKITTRQRIRAHIAVPEAALWQESRALYNLNPDLGTRTAIWLVQNIMGLESDPPATTTPAESAALATVLARVQSTPTWMYPFVEGSLNQLDEISRTQVEAQSAHVISESLQMVGGLGWRSDYLDSQIFVNGRVFNTVSWLFGHVEYRPQPWLAINAGGYREHNDLSGNTFAPRLAVNAQAAPGHTFRAVISKGLRTPDVFEERANWRYSISNLSRPVDGSTTGSVFFAARSPGGLSSEKIWSRELGYLIQRPQQGFSLDIRVFDERLSNLISAPLSANILALNNNGTARLSGAEAQWQWEINADWSLWGQYGQLLNWQANRQEERSQYSRHSGALGTSCALGPGWRISLAHYSSSGDGPHESGYARTDLTLHHDTSAGLGRAHFALTASQLHTPETTYYVDTSHYGISRMNRRLRLLAQMRVAF